MAQELELIAIEAVRLGGAVIRRMTEGRPAVETKSAWYDLVTAVDKAVEEAVADLIERRYPDHGFLGEEGLRGRPGDTVWILDPIDGTTNYAHTLPNFVVSLACYRGTEGLTAAVYDPSRNELFHGSPGRGARLNGDPIGVDPAANLSESVISTNLLWDRRPGGYKDRPQLQEMAAQVRGVRSLGAAALELCYVACGRLSGFAQGMLGPWDYAAGALLVTLAGGRATDLEGNPLPILKPSTVLATNGRLHSEMMPYLRQR